MYQTIPKNIFNYFHFHSTHMKHFASEKMAHKGDLKKKLPQATQLDYYTADVLT